jgi:hypothetical protein
MNKMRKSVITQLRYFFHRNGCLRAPNIARRKKEGQDYKKGYEIRFVAQNEEELLKIRSLLSEVGFKSGKPYSKGSQFVQPVYGKNSYEKFRKFI